MKAKYKLKFSNAWIHLIFILLSLACIMPIMLVVMVSISHETDVAKYGYLFFPKRITLAAYGTLLANPGQILRSYQVTIIATAFGTVLGTLLVTSLAFVISRKDYRYRNLLSFYVFFTMLFNGGLVPAYILNVRWLHMKNTVFALFIPMLFNAFYVLLMKGFLQSIPYSLYESAKLDGAGELTVFVRIVLPLSKPAVATVALFYMLQYWNDWFLSSFYTDKNSYLSLQAMLIQVLQNAEFLNSAAGRQLVKNTPVEIPTLTARMATCIVAAGPMLLVFPFFQQYFVKGLILGSIKG